MKIAEALVLRKHLAQKVAQPSVGQLANQLSLLEARVRTLENTRKGLFR